MKQTLTLSVLRSNIFQVFDAIKDKSDEVRINRNGRVYKIILDQSEDTKNRLERLTLKNVVNCTEEELIKSPFLEINWNETKNFS